MAEIKAKVVANNEGRLTLHANRQSSCSKCNKSQFCALTWQVSDKNAIALDQSSVQATMPETIATKSLTENNAYAITPQASCSEQEQHNQEATNQVANQVTSQVTITCDDKSLLLYISLIFLPSLAMLLIGSTFISVQAKMFEQSLPIFIIVLVFIGALALGAFISQGLIKKYAKQLKAPIISSVPS